MTLPKVFVASSSEALDVVNVVGKLLRRALSRSSRADVTPWPGVFELSETYIKSLELILDTADFAVIVFTPDDRTESRKKKKLSPRDNVVLELGLCFGRLGRKRCFVLQRGDLALKLPSDLLGIKVAEFSVSRGQNLETALKDVCAEIGKAIRDRIQTLPSRPKLGDAEHAAQAAMRKFGDRIIGEWWERIELKGEAPALSFLTIDLDDAYSSVRLEGEAYGDDGTHLASWNSVAARLEGERKIVYARECRRRDKNTVSRSGLGEIDFVVSSGGINRGAGKFWESDESRPKDTVIKTVELRRNLEKSDKETMQEGSDSEKRALVREKLGSWAKSRS